MSDNYGQCKYCGMYRQLNYGDGYCSERCYAQSGQQTIDEEREAAITAEREGLWYYRDDFFAVAFRTLVMTICWGCFIEIITYVINLGIKNKGWTISPLPNLGIVIETMMGFVVSIIQNIIMRHKGKVFRCIILYGIPIAIFVSVLHGCPQKAHEKIRERQIKSIEKEARNFTENYKSEWDVVAGQNYSFISLGLWHKKDVGNSKKLKNDMSVVFAKDGFFFGANNYKINAKKRTITVKGQKGKIGGNDDLCFRYFDDGSVLYQVDKEGALKHSSPASYNVPVVYIKQGATFDAEKAKEVIGETFKGKWSRDLTASITFGENGTASVTFADGGIGTGAYIASDDDNIVVYNHCNEGIWFIFSYQEGGSKLLKFERFYYDEKLSCTKTWYNSSWKKQ